MSPAYRAPWWLPGAHAQTIVPARLLPVPRIAYRRERWDTPDGDFIDIDFAQPEPATQEPGVPVLVLFHGLEGSAQSHYARLLMQGATARGWHGLVVHFRGCSGEPNRLPRAYHSGDSDEIDWILRRVAVRWPQSRRLAAGISLGGNALAKWAGERGADASVLEAAAVVSAPLDLVAGGHALGRGSNRVYTAEFLRTLRAKALMKVRAHPGLADAARIAASRSLRDFDDAFTAPVHGFAGVLDYWSRASARPWLRGVRIPLLLLNARNDSFVPRESLPGPGDVAGSVVLEQPEQGGHVGFFSAAGSADRWYLRQRVFDFLKNYV